MYIKQGDVIYRNFERYDWRAKIYISSSVRYTVMFPVLNTYNMPYEWGFELLADNGAVIREWDFSMYDSIADFDIAPHV